MSGEFCGSFGINSKFGHAASGAIDAAINDPTARLEILLENFQYPDELVGGSGLTGSINEVVHHLRSGQRLVQGGFVAQFGPNELEPFKNMLCGNAGASQTKDSFDLVPKDFSVLRENVAHGYRYCVLRNAKLRGQSNPEDQDDQITQMACQFFGVEEQGITFPSGLALPTTDRLFWLVGDSTLSIAGDDFPIIFFEIEIKNMLMPLFRNKLKPGCFRNLGREITIEAHIPFSTTAEAAIADTHITDTEVVLSLVADNLPADFSDYSTVFTFPTCRRISKINTTNGRGEIPLKVKFKSYQNATGTTMSIENVITEA